MKILISLYFVIFVLITGCFSTEGTLHIEGKVIDEATKEPIPFRNVIVQGLVLNDENYIPVEVGLFSTDSSGFFKYSFRKVKDAFYYNFCMVGDSNYTYTVKKMPVSPLRRSARDLSFSLNKLTDLTIHIDRVASTPRCDTLILSWKSDGLDGRSLFPYKINNSGLISTSDLIWVGGKVSSTVKTRAYAEKRTVLRWALIRNKKVEIFTDTIICKRDLVNEVSLRY